MSHITPLRHTFRWYCTRRANTLLPLLRHCDVIGDDTLRHMTLRHAAIRRCWRRATALPIRHIRLPLPLFMPVITPLFIITGYSWPHTASLVGDERHVIDGRRYASAMMPVGLRYWRRRADDSVALRRDISVVYWLIRDIMARYIVSRRYMPRLLLRQ